MKKGRIFFLLTVLLFIIYKPVIATEPHIEWDPEPNARGYVVEINDESNKAVVRMRTSKTFYRVELPPGKYFFRLAVINSANERGAVSQWKEFTVISGSETGDSDKSSLNFMVTVTPAYYMPAGVMKELFKPGFGGYLNVGLCNVIWRNFQTGAGIGLFSLPGNNDRGIDSGIMSSLRLYSGYMLMADNFISVLPYAGAGMNYMAVTYIYEDLFTSDRIIDPAVTGGVTLFLNFNNLKIPFGAAGSALYESKGFVYDYTIYGGIGIVF